MDWFVESLKRKRQGLLKEIAALQEAGRRIQEDASRRLDEFQTRHGLLEAKLQHIEQLLLLETQEKAPAAEVSADNTKTERTSEAEPEAISVAEAAYQTLQEMGQPVHYKELAVCLLRKGIRLPGKDPAGTLLAHLTRDDRFLRPHKRGEYGLREWYGRVRNVGQRKRRTRKKGPMRKSIRSPGRSGGSRRS